MTIRSGTGLTPPARLLAILVLVYVVSLFDRTIVSILAIPIKKDLQLQDYQLGLLGGLAFAAFYAICGLPIAWLADRRSRIKIISTAVAIWSLFTALCGFTTTFLQIFVTRMGVGIGEAGGIAPAYSLITDNFPRHKRARALAIFTIGSPIGAAFGILFGGWIATNFNWRVAFIATGLAGLPVAALVRFGIREPLRGGLDGEMKAVTALPIGQVIRNLLGNRTFWLISAGATLSNVPVNGLLFWLPSFLIRSQGLSLLATSWYFGSIALIGGVAGMAIGGTLADRLGQRTIRAFMLIPAISFLASAPFFALAFLTFNPFMGWFLFLVPQTLGYFYVGPMLTAVNQIVLPSMRATTAATFLLCANLIGTGLGVPMLGWISDTMSRQFGNDGLRYAMLCSLAFYFLAAIAFLLASRTIERDWCGQDEATVSGN